MSLESKPILVTGASGFIGSHLTRHLYREGAHVLAGMRDPEKGAFLSSQGIEVVRFIPYPLSRTNNRREFVFFSHQLSA